VDIFKKKIGVSEVLEILNIGMPEFFELCKTGRLTVYNSLGKKLVDKDSCEKTKEYTLEQIIKFVRAGEMVFYPAMAKKVLTEEEIKIEAQMIYNAMPLNTLIIPDGRVDFDFSLPDWPSKQTQKKFAKALSFKCKKSDVLNLLEDIKRAKGADDFVKNLVLHPVNDNEISFQAGQKKVTFTLDRLGKEQKIALKKILDDPEHIYSLGPASKEQVKKYYRRKDRLKQLSEKFIDFVNNEFDARIPTNYFLFELRREEGTGKYKPIFKIAGSRDCEKEIEKLRKKPQSELIKELKKALEIKDFTYDEEYITGRINALKEQGMQKGDLNKLFRSTLIKGEVISLFAEHPPDVE